MVSFWKKNGTKVSEEAKLSTVFRLFYVLNFVWIRILSTRYLIHYCIKWIGLIVIAIIIICLVVIQCQFQQKIILYLICTNCIYIGNEFDVNGACIIQERNESESNILVRNSE